MLAAQPVLACHVGTTRAGVEDWHFLFLVDLSLQTALVCDGCGVGRCAVVEGPDLVPLCQHCIRHDENLPIVLLEHASHRPCRHCGATLRRAPEGQGLDPWVAADVDEALCPFGRNSRHIVTPAP